MLRISRTETRQVDSRIYASFDFTYEKILVQKYIRPQVKQSRFLCSIFKNSVFSLSIPLVKFYYYHQLLTSYLNERKYRKLLGFQTTHDFSRRWKSERRRTLADFYSIYRKVFKELCLDLVFLSIITFITPISFPYRDKQNFHSRQNESKIDKLSLNLIRMLNKLHENVVVLY